MRIGEFFSLLQNNEEYSSVSYWEHFVCQSLVTGNTGNKAEPDVNTLHVHTCLVLCLTSRAHLSVMVTIGCICVCCVWHRLQSGQQSEGS